MKLLKTFTILFLLTAVACFAVIFHYRSNNLIPSPLYLYGAIFCPIMAIVTKGAEIEEKERQKGEG